jgi:hypothetical protein
MKRIERHGRRLVPEDRRQANGPVTHGSKPVNICSLSRRTRFATPRPNDGTRRRKGDEGDQSGDGGDEKGEKKIGPSPTDIFLSVPIWHFIPNIPSLIPLISFSSFFEEKRGISAKNTDLVRFPADRKMAVCLILQFLNRAARQSCATPARRTPFRRCRT